LAFPNYNTLSTKLAAACLIFGLQSLFAWKGASFGVQFLRFDGQDTNGQAGGVQGYNSLPGPKPLDRSELYELWYRQALFDGMPAPTSNLLSATSEHRA
jgi:porin